MKRLIKWPIIVLAAQAIVLSASDRQAGLAPPQCDLSGGAPDRIRILRVRSVNLGKENLLGHGFGPTTKGYYPVVGEAICVKLEEWSQVTYTSSAIDTKVGAVASDLEKRDDDRKAEVEALIKRVDAHEARTGDPAQQASLAALAKRIEELERVVKELQGRQK